MTFVPSWRYDIFPRKCAGCGKRCWESNDWSRYYRELCHGCLEMFCKECVYEHKAFECETPKCGKTIEDWPDVKPLEPRHERDVIPGWKAALVQKHIPGAVVTYHGVHTAGWTLRFFLNIADPDAATLSRVALEELCEALHADWTAYPVVALQPSHGVNPMTGKHYEVPPPKVPEGCENGIMVCLEYVS